MQIGQKVHQLVLMGKTMNLNNDNLMHYPEEGEVFCKKYCEILEEPGDIGIGRILRLERILISCVEEVETKDFLSVPIERLLDQAQKALFIANEIGSIETKKEYKAILISFLSSLKEITQSMRSETIKYQRKSFSKRVELLKNFTGDCSSCEYKIDCALNKV